MENTVNRKIFISHSRKDMELGKTIVQLLLDMGIKEEQIVFTSISQYGIPLGYSIFKYLKEQIQHFTNFFILINKKTYNLLHLLYSISANKSLQK